jgi:hypothetical protein
MLPRHWRRRNIVPALMIALLVLAAFWLFVERPSCVSAGPQALPWISDSSAACPDEGARP